MPRLSETTKDVVSCDKLRGVANELWSADVRMGQPLWLKTIDCTQVRRQPGELKHLSTRRKRNQRDSLSSGERTGISPLSIVLNSRSSLESYTVESESLVNETKHCVNWVGRDTWNPVWIWGDHPPRLNTPERPIVNQYREGKVKRTPKRGVKRPWNHTLTSGRSLAAMRGDGVPFA